MTKIVNDSKETLSYTVLSPGLLIIHANAQHLWSLYFTHANKAQGSTNNGNTQMTGKSDCKYCFQHVLSQAISKCSLFLLINILHPSEILGEVFGSKPGLICIPCSLCSPRAGRSSRQEMKGPGLWTRGSVSAASPDQSLQGNAVKTAFPQVPHSSQTVMAKANYQCGGFSCLPQEEKRFSGPVVSRTKRIYRS